MLGMLDARIFALFAVIILAMGFALGLFSWDDNKYKCMEGKHWDRSERVTVFEIGRLKLNAFPWDCPQEMRYDPKELKKTNALPDVTPLQ